MRLTIFILFLLSAIVTEAQNSIRISKDIDWKNEKKSIVLRENEIKEILDFEGAGIDASGQLPVYGEKIKINTEGKVLARFSKTTYQPLEHPELITDKSLIKESIEITADLGKEKKQPYALVSFIPIRFNSATGIYEKLISFELECEVIPERKITLRAGHNYASNSILASGKWYKIAVEENGIHKIDRNFLQSLGIDVSNLNPKNIRIYGNGGGMLPEANSAKRIDDLAELTIYIEGESDNKFDAGDFILFYAHGPDQWHLDTIGNNGNAIPTFKHSKHLYDTKSYYFITVDNGVGKRISNANISGTANKIIESFDDRIIHEQDKYNLISSGRRWMGDVFNYNDNPKSYPFTFPNIISDSTVHIKTAVAARSMMAKPRFNITSSNLSYTATCSVGGSTYDGLFAGIDDADHFITSMPAAFNVNIQFLPPSMDPESKGWLDYIAVVAKRKLIMTGTEMSFRSLNSVQPNAISEFRIQNASNIKVWDVTDIHNVKQMQLQNESFLMYTDTLREFVAFTGNSFKAPTIIGEITNQNIHGTIGQPDMVIVTHPNFISAAENLATLHMNKSSLEVAVITIDKIYNEFSSGAQDITAIRDLMKMLYERAANQEELPQYLLLFGDGSFDYKNTQVAATVNTNFIPTYQSYESMHNASSFTSDDYFGLLDDNEGHNIALGNQLLDVAVGRFSVSSVDQANDILKKIETYVSKASFGNWRNVITFIGDDEDSNLHFNQANALTTTIESKYPVYNLDKIFLDAYPQVSTPGGSRYPAVNTAINNRIYSGTLVLNYIGHGGENGLAHERILGFSDINSWKNEDKFPLLVTATCSFSRFDNPERYTAGEAILAKKNGGAIALVTTVRLVYAGENDALNKKFFEQIFEPKTNSEMPTLGDAIMSAKNNVSGGVVNKRKFLLLGDPALHLAYPKHDIVTTKVENQPYSGIGDTLKALAKVTITGEVRNSAGAIMNKFNGFVYPTIYDKPSEITTLKNDQGSHQATFKLQKNIIYKGKASVVNGEFTYTFIVPKDIAYNFGTGKISYYAHTDATDAHGYNLVTIGGNADSVADDNLGPQVEIFMNDEKFVFGGLTNPEPIMIVKLSDENGINTAGSAIGHDISGLLDDDSKNKFTLNEFYEAELDNYQKGTVRYPLSSLAPGRHTVSVKAWDVYNNPGDGYTEFIVAESAELALKHVLNYPNPFTTNTSFWFEHNKPGQMLNVQVQVFTVSGKLIKNIQQDVISEGFRVDNITWNGLDEYGDKIGKGVYVYKVKVRAEDGSQASKFEKLVVLQ